jgi:hypothetical protein
MTVKVWRKGVQSLQGRRITEAIIKVEYGKACLAFRVGRGAGGTHYSLEIETDSYADLIRAMLRAAPEQATKAIGSALQDGIPKRVGETELWVPPVQAA